MTRGAAAVVNCVGILEESGKQTFDSVQSKGAARIARIAAEEGVDRLVQISAIGADPEAASAYARTKGLGEAAVLDAFPGAMIVRPSIIFGHEDEFFNRFAGMARVAPLVPLVGASTRFQPVYVDDVAAAIQMGITGRAEPGVYELGGPDVSTFRELIREMLAVIRRRALVLNTPMPVAKLMGRAFDLVRWGTWGVIRPPLTYDQVVNLGHDNVVGEGVKTFADLGIQPTAMEAILSDYLWRFRPSGQYAEANASAAKLHAKDTKSLDRDRAGFS